MAQYLLLIYREDAAVAAATPERTQEVVKAHLAFHDRHAAAVLGANALHNTDTATTVRRDGSGAFAVTDGPFAETKEALGGYYLVEAADLDEAVALAKDLPDDFGGGIEVRPVRVFD